MENQNSVKMERAKSGIVKAQNLKKIIGKLREENSPFNAKFCYQFGKEHV
jgi:hypothetical protein